MMNTARMVNIYHLLAQVLVFDVPGEVVELGCHKGQSAILIREIMNHHRSEKEFHVYDSFLGLPQRHENDAGAVFAPGALQVSRLELLNSFAQTNLEPPVVHEGWFEDTLPNELPKRICFSHIDSDFYMSILHALESVYPRLSRAAIVIIDDYDWEGLPGANRAVDDFLRTKPERICPMRLGPLFDATHAFFRRVP